MSVIVKDMELPKSCDVCEFFQKIDGDPCEENCYCGFPGFGMWADDYIACRHPECPLEEMDT